MTTSTGLTPRECVRLLIEYRQRWIVPMVICGVLATGYAIVKPRYWQASQALVVRSEVSGPSQGKPGKFSDVYEMRTFQETILELAKSRQVLNATLKAVEEAETEQPAQEPTSMEIQSLRKHFSLLPPKGAEFGKTEIFYLSVQDKDRDRSVRLVDELCKQLDLRLRGLRNEQAQSVVAELEMQVKLASAAHDTETASLEKFEVAIGLDLGELRMLHTASSGQSELRQQTVALETEHRVSEAQVHQAKQLLEVLRSAQNSPEALVAMPSSLLKSQPTLRSLKDGLISAQLRAARLAGTRTAEHPQMQAATKAVERVRNDLHAELQVAIKGVEIDLEVTREHSQMLGEHLANVQRRLNGLAQHRAEYTNRVAAVENSREVIAQARKQLGELRAVQVAAQNTKLVTPIDRPEVGDNPIGLGRSSLVMAGTLGGFILGMGCLFLTVSPIPTIPEPAVAEAVVNRGQAERGSWPGVANESFGYPSAVTTSATTAEVSGNTTIVSEVFNEHMATTEDLSVF
ncbi:MAG: hypothetical protein GXP26_17315 [Planctomycetes bacterium]|nr:hypothetical protein [Planctomycetota bacterium]